MNTKRFRHRAEQLAVFCREKGYNCDVVLLWNLSLHSGRRRFVVWNVAKGRAEHCFVCSHGSGSAKNRVRSAYAECSNAEGSHLSSVGRALVAERYEGRYGVSYGWTG